MLGQHRDPLELRREVGEMRRRMRASITSSDLFKHGEGGLVDIEFVAQLGVLECAHSEPGLLQYTGSGDLIPALSDCGWLSDRQAAILTRTHGALTHARQLVALSRNGAVDMPDTRQAWKICCEFLG